MEKVNSHCVSSQENKWMTPVRHKGKQGKVLQVSPKEQKVIVEGLNMVTVKEIRYIIPLTTIPSTLSIPLAR